MDLNNDDKKKISHLLVERKIKGLPGILITENIDMPLNFRKDIQKFTIKMLLDNYPHGLLERIDRSLLNLSHLIKEPYDDIILEANMKRIIFFFKYKWNELYFRTIAIIKLYFHIYG